MTSNHNLKLLIAIGILVFLVVICAKMEVTQILGSRKNKKTKNNDSNKINPLLNEEATNSDSSMTSQISTGESDAENNQTSFYKNISKDIHGLGSQEMILNEVLKENDEKRKKRDIKDDTPFKQCLSKNFLYPVNLSSYSEIFSEFDADIQELYHQYYCHFIKFYEHSKLTKIYQLHSMEILQTAAISAFCSFYEYEIKNGVEDLKLNKDKLKAFKNKLMRTIRRLNDHEVHMHFLRLNFCFFRFSRMPFNGLYFINFIEPIEEIIIRESIVGEYLDLNLRILDSLKHIQVHSCDIGKFPYLIGLRLLNKLELINDNITDLDLREYDTENPNFNSLKKVNFIDLSQNYIERGNSKKFHDVFPKLKKNYI